MLSGNDSESQERDDLHCRPLVSIPLPPEVVAQEKDIEELFQDLIADSRDLPKEVIIVRDQGEGFGGGTVPGPTEPERVFLTSRRGLHLMRTVMDNVSFEENGTVVRMRKRLAGPLTGTAYE